MFANKKLLRTMCPGDAYAHQATHTHSQPLFLRLCMILLLSLVGMGAAWAEEVTLNNGGSKVTTWSSGNFTVTFNTTNNAQTNYVKLSSNDTGVFSTSGSETISSISIQYGTSTTDYSSKTAEITVPSTSNDANFTASTTDNQVTVTAKDWVYISSVTISYVTSADPATPIISITTQPTGGTFTQFTAASPLTVVASASNSATLTYKWQSANTDNDASYKNISNATKATYDALTSVGNKWYRCVISADGCESVKSNAVQVNVTGGDKETGNLTKITTDYLYTPNAAIPQGTLTADGKILSAAGGSNYTSNGLNIKDNRYIAISVAAGATLNVTAGNHGTNGDRTLYVSKAENATNESEKVIAQGSTETLSVSQTEEAVYYIHASSDLYIKNIRVAFPHTVTYNLNGGTGTTPTQEDVVTGTTFTVASADGITKDGFTFNGWNDGTRTYLAGDTYTMGAANVTLTAQWQQNAGSNTVNDLVTITEDFKFIPSVLFDKDKLYEDGKLFSAGGNGFSSNGMQFKSNRAIAFKVNYGAVIKVTAKSNNNSETRDIQLGTSTSNYKDLATLGVAPAATATLTYTYTGANDGLIYLTSNSELFLKELDVIYSPSYTVTYNLNGGTGTAPTQEAMYEGDSFTIASDDGITKTGYTFVAWNDGKDNYADGDSYTMGAANVTFTAQWEANTYEVKYKDEGNANFSGDGGTESFPTRHTYGTATVLPTPTKVGYAFGGWFISNDCSGEAITQIAATAITGNITLYAKWVLDGETITWEDSWLTKESTRKQLGKGQSMHLTFHNKSNNDTQNYYNWILAAGTSTALDRSYMALRADVWDNNNTETTQNSTRVMKQNGDDVDWDVFKADMAAGADVDIYVANSGSKLYVHATMTAASNTYDYTAETVNSAETVWFALMGQQCTLTGIKFDAPVTAYSVIASPGEKCESVSLTNALGMTVSSGIVVPSGEKITFTATPSSPSYIFEGWKTEEYVQDTKNPTTLAITLNVDVKAVYADAPTPTIEVTSVLVAGKEYKETLTGNIFTAGTYYGDPTIEVTLSDGTKPVVTKDNQNNISTTSVATFNADGVNYIINYKQKDVSTQDLTALSDKTATTWNFNQLTRPSSIINNWTWNNMTIFASEENQIKVGGNSSSFIENLPVGAQRQQSFAIITSGPGTLTFNAEATGSRNVKIVDYNGSELGNITIGHVGGTGANYSWEYNGGSMPIYFYVSDNPVSRINSITWTPKQPVTSITIPEAVTVHVGELHRFQAGTEVVFKNGDDVVNSSELEGFTAAWTISNNKNNYVDFGNTTRIEGKVTGLKSNTSDNATITAKLTIAGVESNECTVTIVRTPLAVRADHVALSHNGGESRTLNAVAYNPYNRAVVSSNIDLTAAPRSGESAFATSTGNTITPTGSAIGTEVWTVTATPKSGKTEASNYIAGTADIQVTCRDYLYAYNTSKPATTPTARPVENATGDVALNYYAGHNPAGCYGYDEDTKQYYILKTWGDSNRAPQEQTLANYRAPGTNSKDDKGQKPYARIHGWDGIKNIAEPTMNSLSEQHTRTGLKNDASNGTFTYKQYSYSGDHDEFNVPVMGSFYRFYPEKNGTLIAYLCVNGQFSDSQMNSLASGGSTGYANRNTYFLDPYANSMEILNATIQPTSTIQTGFFYYTLDNCTGLDNFKRDVVELLNNWSAWGNDEKDANGELIIPVKSTSYYPGLNSYTINDVDWNLFKKLAQDKVGIFQQPIPNGDGSFRVITKTYVRCEVPVEKGRVYYVSPTGTKTRMAGVEFIPANDDPVAENVDYYNGVMKDTPKTDTTPYIVESDQNTWMIPSNNGKYYNVTLKDRSFKAGQWYSFCMPFDVPQKQIHDIFGADAVTIHFDNVSVDGDNIKMNFWSHFYDQTRAGRPIMIKMPATFPDGSTTLATGSVTFQHVKLNVVEPSTLFITDGEWTFKGSYTPVTMEKNAVILNNQTFYHYKNTAKTLAGNRAWIQGPSESAAKYNLVTTFSMFNEDEGDTITGIEEILSEMGLNMMKTNDNIYNVNGQVVGKGSDITTLPKGVYIVNGKKQIVK